MVWCVKALAAEVGNLSSVFGIHMVGGRKEPTPTNCLLTPHGLCGVYMCRFPQERNIIKLFFFKVSLCDGSAL